MNDLNLSGNLKEKYNDLYNESSGEWREVSAKNKVQHIIELTKGMKFNNVLEVGSGDGSILLLLEENNFNQNLYALEISESGINQIKSRNLKYLKEVKSFDGYHIPFDDHFFDLVICTHVIEHVEFPRALLREISRVSKYQVFEIPIEFSFNVDKKVRHFLSYGHINIYYPGLFKFLIQSEGFEILKEKFGFFSNQANKMIYKNNKAGYYKNLLKNFILKAMPLIGHIKPNTYTALTQSTVKKLEVF